MTREAYGYVGGDPLNNVDPSGLRPAGKPTPRLPDCPSGYGRVGTRGGGGSTECVPMPRLADVSASVTLVVVQVGISTTRGPFMGWGLGSPGASINVTPASACDKSQPSVTTGGYYCRFGLCGSFGTGLDRGGNRTNTGSGFGFGTPQAGWMTTWAPFAN